MSAIGKCPWPGCGGDVQCLEYGVQEHAVDCQNCGACGPFHTSEEAAITAWNRLATPDPERVTGRVRWEGDGNILMFGPFYCGFIRPIGSEWRSSANCGGDGMSTIHPTEASARAALVAAVKEAIGDE
jgi:hypothetical protein